MANRLKMAVHQSILGLASLNWSYRRIAAELSVDRETVSRHVRSARAGLCGSGPPQEDGANAAIVITGSEDPGASAVAGAGESNAANVITGSEALPAADGPAPNATIVITGSAGRHSRCEPWRAIILQGLERGLTARRIWQDLKAEHGADVDYQCVQRFVRALKHCTPLPFRRMECAPGEEAQVDFGRGAPVVGTDGKQQEARQERAVRQDGRDRRI